MAIFGDLHTGQHHKQRAQHEMPRKSALEKSHGSHGSHGSIATASIFIAAADDLAADPDDVRLAFRWWEKLDPRFVGVVHTSELLQEILVSRNQTADHFKARRMELGAASLARLLSSSVTVEDFVAIIWPDCNSRARREIKGIIAYLVYMSMSVEPLACLDDNRRLDYLAVFEQMDLDGSGTLEVDELEETGLFTPEDFADIVQRYDTDGDGTVDMVEFLELVTPEGYRGHPYCTSCNTVDGERLQLYEGLKSLPTKFRGWMKESTAMDLPRNKMLKALGIQYRDYPAPLSWKDQHPRDADYDLLQRQMKLVTELRDTSSVDLGESDYSED
jgi:hypothetical protein